ncbi:MAG: hypothetical protein KC502_12580 [Myxococcales bacterium]|nr:hypothetical protein [Myxococcales bacterium]
METPSRLSKKSVVTSRGTWPLLCAFIVVLLGGCGGPFQVVQSRPLAAEGPKIKGFIVFPVADMTPGAKPIDASVRASDVAGWLLDRTELPVVGHLDFKSFKAPDDMRMASVDTDLVTRKDSAQPDLHGWVSVWVQVTENRATNVRDLVDMRRKGKKNQKVYRMHGVEATVRVEVRLRDAMRGRTKAVIVVKDIDDPTRMRLKGDPRPRVTQLIERALGLVLEEAEERVAPEKLSRLIRRKGTVANATGLAGYGTPTKPSLIDEYKKKGEVDLKTALVTLWSRLAPELGIRVTYFPTKYPGLLFTADRAPLKSGDVVRSVDGEQIWDRCQLDRVLRSCETCKAHVQRGFKELYLPLRWQPVPRPDQDDP